MVFLKHIRNKLIFLFLIFIVDYYLKGLFSALFYYFFHYSSFSYIADSESIFFFNYIIRLYLGDFYTLIPDYKLYLIPDNFLIKVERINYNMLHIILIPKNLDVLWQHADTTGSFFIECYYFYNYEEFLYFYKIYIDLLHLFGFSDYLDLSNKNIGVLHDMYYYTIHCSYWVSYCKIIDLYFLFFYYSFSYYSYIYLYTSLFFSVATLRVFFIFRHIYFLTFLSSWFSN